MMEVARLISQEGLKQAEVAERLDCSTRWVSLQWRKFLLLLHQDDLVPEELRRDVRLFAETGLRDLIEKGLLQYEETAAYGAVVLQSIRTLLEMHGAMAPEAGDESEAEVEKVVEDLKVRSPLVRERLERLEAAKKKRQEEMARGRSEGG